MKKPEYFPILDSMRFVAAMAVFVAHSVSFFRSPGAPVSFGPFLENAGYYGVVFFYSLSGFLITYILLREKEETGTIALRRFYGRRALRIWPLYYLMTILSFVLFPRLGLGAGESGGGSWSIAFLLYLCFLPNVAILTGYFSPASFQLYTIGFEEQFYLFWPLLIRKAVARPVGLLASVFFLPMVLSLFHEYAHARHLLDHGGGWLIVKGALTYIDYSCVPAFAAGGAAAYWYRRAGEAQLRLLGRKIWGYLPGAAVLLLMWLGKPWAPGYVNLLALLFVLLILHLIVRGQGLGRGVGVGHGDGVGVGFGVGLGRGGGLSLIERLMAGGGRISYGIYVYHPVVMLVVSLGLARIGAPRSPMVNYLLFTLSSLVFVLGIAALSYRFFESRFLRRRATRAIFQDRR